VYYCPSNKLVAQDKATWNTWWGTSLPTAPTNFWDRYRVCAYNYRNADQNGDGRTHQTGGFPNAASLRSYTNSKSHAIVTDSSEDYERPNGSAYGTQMSSPHGGRFANVLTVDGAVTGWRLPGNVFLITWHYARGGRAGPPSYFIAPNDSGASYFYWMFDQVFGNGPGNWALFTP
jgi:prepilin-type processing-associated H-X9-DG protein